MFLLNNKFYAMKFNKLKREQNINHKHSGRWPVLPLKVKEKTDNPMDLISICGCEHYVSFKSNKANDETLEVLLCDVVVWLSANIFIQVSPSWFINMHHFDTIKKISKKWEISMDDNSKIPVTEGFHLIFDKKFPYILSLQKKRRKKQAIEDNNRFSSKFDI